MLHRPLAIALLAALTLGGLPLIGNAAATPAAACEWNAWADFRLSPAQANPSPDSCGHAGVWSYLSSATAHDTSTYVTMSDHLTNWAGHPASELWCAAGGCGLPVIGVNHGDPTWTSGTVTVPANSMFAHPGYSSHAILGWTSPITGVVSITGGLASDDANGGNGIVWYLDQGNAPLASGGYGRGGAQNFADATIVSPISSVHVNAGETLYLIIDRAGDYTFDSTRIDLTISNVTPPPAPLPELPSIALAGVGIVVIGLVALRTRK